MYQFFVEPQNIMENRVVISGDDVNHIKNVLRMKIGDEIAVSNGIDGKEYRCGIEAIGDEVICKLHFIKEDGLELSSHIYLFQGLPKSEKMEFVIQKAVELGIYEIIAVSNKRSVVKLDEKKEKNKINRWQEIAHAAAKQSKRRIIPKINQVMTMKQAVDFSSDFDLVIIPYELAEGMDKTRKVIESVRPGQKIGIFIGPEGGFEEEEINLAVENGIIPITLGKRILRTETAGLTVLSWIMYQLEGKDIV